MTHIERKILRIIQNYIHMKGKYPSYKRLAQYTGRSERDVRSIVLKLQQEGKFNHISQDQDGREGMREK
ncbi:MAG: helix-turn-helix domain-containing protein, partial [Balneolales bacterium]